jgi:tetratricopeptide (TPR) repeat protein
MKGVLEFATETSAKKEYLFAVFKTVIELDPELCSAAFMGGVVLPKKPDDIRKGISLLEEAMKLNTEEWRYPYWIGFNYSQMEEYKTAAEYYFLASRRPGAPAFLTTNLAMLYYKAQSPETAIALFEGLKESVKDEKALAFLQTRIDWLSGIAHLEKKVTEFQKTFGKWPADLPELVEKGFLKEIPNDPFGGGYFLETSMDTGSQTCRVRSHF